MRTTSCFFGLRPGLVALCLFCVLGFTISAFAYEPYEHLPEPTKNIQIIEGSDDKLPAQSTVLGSFMCEISVPKSTPRKEADSILHKACKKVGFSKYGDAVDALVGSFLKSFVGNRLNPQTGKYEDPYPNVDFYAGHVKAVQLPRKKAGKTSKRKK